MSHGIHDRSVQVGSSVPLHNRLIDWLTTQGDVAWSVLVYSSAYLAVIAMIQVVIVMEILSLPLSPAPLVVGLVTFAVYCTDRIADAETDEVSNPAQAAFVRRHETSLSVLSASAYGIAVMLAVLGGPLTLGLALFPGLMWVLYASDWLPELGAYLRRLKEVFLVNTTVVALAWAITLTFVPLSYATVSLRPVIGFIFAYFFIVTFVNTEIPNVRDMEGDRMIGVSTLPVVLGIERTRWTLYGLNLLVIASVWAALDSGYLSTIIAAGLFVGVVYSVVITWFVGRTREEQLLTIAAECSYVPAFLVMAIAGSLV